METADFKAYRDGCDLIMRDSGVLYVDVLGSSAMACSPRALEHLRRLRPALEAAAERSMINESRLLHASTWFTDNLVVAIPVVPPLERVQALGSLEVTAAYHLLICAEHGFLARGGLALGQHYMDERFVFGPALVEAVKLEEATPWPRVLLSPDAVVAERHHIECYYGGGPHAIQRACLLCDADGNTFVDHLGIYIDEEDDEVALDHYVGLHRQAISTALAHYETNCDVYQKWCWLADYHNYTVRGRLPEPAPYLVDVRAPAHAFRPFAPDIKGS